MNKYTNTINQLLKEYGITVKKYRSNTTGRAFIKENAIVIPNPTGKISFMVALHEIGHCVLGDLKPRHYEEYRAEKWAIDKARELGFSVPQRWIKRAKRYVAFKIRQALRRRGHWKNINKEASRFAGVRRGNL